MGTKWWLDCNKKANLFWNSDKKQAPVSVYDVLPEVLYGGLR